MIRPLNELNEIPPWARYSRTSKAAAVSMKAAVKGYEPMVLDFIRSKEGHGATADEVLVGLGLTHQNGSARVSTLAKKELIIKSGRQRKTRSGRKAEVYVAAVFAKEKANGENKECE
jgi:hypothetical protein